jgi:peptidoglycan/xylan/chitin deacetylase (PgdA/CDA1 family)
MIGSHTWSHADLLGITNAQLQDSMFRVEEALSRIIDIKAAFMRPPFGDYDSTVQSVAAARGQSLALWDWDTGDADGNTTAQSEAVYQDMVNDKITARVVLKHETEREPFFFLFLFCVFIRLHEADKVFS